MGDSSDSSEGDSDSKVRGGGLDDALEEVSGNVATNDASDDPLRDEAREKGEATPENGATPQSYSGNSVALTLAASAFRGETVTVSAFADEADCTNQEARNHLNHLCDIGLAEQESVAEYLLYEVENEV